MKRDIKARAIEVGILRRQAEEWPDDDLAQWDYMEALEDFRWDYGEY